MWGHLLFRAASTYKKLNRGCTGENNGIKGSNILIPIATSFILQSVRQGDNYEES
jgi:hypothetical protein